MAKLKPNLKANLKANLNLMGKSYRHKINQT